MCMPSHRFYKCLREFKGGNLGTEGVEVPRGLAGGFQDLHFPFRYLLSLFECNPWWQESSFTSL